MGPSRRTYRRTAALALHYDGHASTVVSAPPVSPAAGTATSSQLARVAASNRTGELIQRHAGVRLGEPGT